MAITQKHVDELSYKIIGCAIEVHKHLGPGLLESVYEKFFLRELSLKHLSYQSQKRIPLYYKGETMDSALRYDVLVEELIVVELKAILEFAPIHEAVLYSYMRLLEKPKGILINFNCINIFKEGQRTMVNKFYADLPKA